MANCNKGVEQIMSPPPDIIVICFCVVEGENEELLGVDESPITEIHWIAIDVVENKVCCLVLFIFLCFVITLRGLKDNLSTIHLIQRHIIVKQTSLIIHLFLIIADMYLANSLGNMSLANSLGNMNFYL